jgi:hypothetical protein
VFAKIFPIVFFITTLSLQAQQFQRRVDVPIVQTYTGTLLTPSLGGTYVPKLSFVDTDLDGDVDLLITQPDGRVSHYQNTGSALEPVWTWTTDFFDSLNVGPWAAWADLDNDGDADLLAGRNNSTFAYYENTGNAHFELRQDPVVDSTGSTILSESQSIPTLCDIDGDGDLDFFTGRSAGTLAFYRNVGTATAVSFKFVTEQFEDISIITPAKPLAGSLHGASSVNFADIDADGDQDLFWGDFFSSSIYFLENTGDSSTADIPGITTSQFPDASMSTRGFNRPIFTDIDNDGDLDLFVAALFRDTETDNFWFYRNDGTAAVPSYTLATKNYLPQLDVGRYAHPAWVDIDNDQDLDLFVGSYSGTVRFYRNIGTNTIELQEDTTVTIPVPSDIFVTAPAFYDIDGDGDLDAVVGNFNGRLLLFRNNGTSSIPLFTLESSNYQSVDVGNYSTPNFSDIDGDGDVDLWIGEESGTVNWLRNSSSSTTFVADSLFQNFITLTGHQDAIPESIDIDNDGDRDLLIGTRSGYLALYENKGMFELRDSSFMQIKTTGHGAPRFVDWDGDGDPDLMLGTLRGGIEFFENVSSTPILFQPKNDTTFAAKTYSNDLLAYGNPPPVFDLADAPAGMSIDSATGKISWTPSAEQIGEWSVRVRARNPLGTSERTFTVSVLASQPPALTTAVFINPAIPRSIDIAVTSDEPLLFLTVHMWQSTDTTDIPMTEVDPRVFRGSHYLDSSGVYFLRIHATGIGGKDSIQTRPLTIVLARAGEPFNLANLSGNITVHGTAAGEMTAVHFHDQVRQFEFSESADVEFRLDSIPASGLAIRRKTDGGSETVTARIDVHRMTATARFSSGGEFFLESQQVPAQFQLYANYPNPFNPVTTIRFDIPQESVAELSVYNMLGQRVRRLIKGSLPPGSYHIQWDGRNEAGQTVASGLYLYRLRVGRFVATRKMLMVR